MNYVSKYRAICGILTGLMWLWAAAAVNAQEPIQFIGIKASADDDKLLRTFLTQKTSGALQFQAHTMALNTAVRRLSDWKGNERYLAHMTPYACVAAEITGMKSTHSLICLRILVSHSSPCSSPPSASNHTSTPAARKDSQIRFAAATSCEA